MSYIDNKTIINNNSKKSSIDENNNIISYASNKSEHKSHQKKKYKYNYSNSNNCENELKTFKIENKDNIKNTNIKCIKAKNKSISPTSQSFYSPSKLNCETNISINNLTNTYYVNGLNKNILKNNSNRSPDIRFIHFEKKDNLNKKNCEYNNGKKESFFTNISFKGNKNYINKYVYDNKYMKHNNKENIENQKINKVFLDNNINKKTLITNNHSFKSIRNFSSKGNKIKREFSNNKKYKCDIKIHNLNNQTKENIRHFSYDNSINKRDKTKTKVFISDHSKVYENLEYQLNRQKSFDKNYLKMQNSQNIQILQEEKLYQILVPIPPNEIDFICNFQIPSIDKSKKIIRKRIISEKELNHNNYKKINYFKKQIKYNKKTSWSKVNQPKKIESFNIDHFSINYEQNSRKFIGEMNVERTDLNFERIPRNWNNLFQAKSNNLNIINDKPNEGTLKQNEEKFFIKGNEKNWNNRILKNIESRFTIKSARGNDKFELEENEDKNIINDDEIEKTLKRNIIINIKKEIKNEVESSESSSTYDALKKISRCNNKKYQNFIRNSFESNGNERKIIINNIHKYPKKLTKMNYELKKNNNCFNQKKETDNNLIIDYQEPVIEMNPKYKNDKTKENTQYNYRESITNKKIFINENRRKKSNKDYLDDENDIEGNETNVFSEINSNIEENQSHNQTMELQSPSSNMRTEYREEIISLSPDCDEGIRENFEENINYKNENEDINFMEEEYQNYFSNNENLEMHSSKLEEEKEIIPKERETNESNIDFNKINSNNNNCDIRHKIQYIYKSKSKNNNKNSIKSFIEQTNVNENIDHNKKYNEDNQNNIYISEDSTNPSKSIREENNHNKKFLNKETSNLFELEKSKNKINDENFVHNQMNDGEKNNIYNSQKLKHNSNFNHLNEKVLQQSNGLSKSIVLQKEKDTNNKFGNTGQINIGNIIINNTLKRKNKKLKINSTKTNRENLIHHYENKKSENNSNNENNKIANKSNPISSKIRILKK